MIELDRDTLRRLQLKELESLAYFDEFCRRNELRYYLLGGCVIGALRHGGFIPWDDDIDLIMPRRDYERMLRLWKTQEADNERFLMLTTDGDVFTGNCFATMVDTSVTLIKYNQKDLQVPRGIVTDIFPMDGCPDGRLTRYIQYYHAMMYSLYITEVVPTKHGKAVELIGRLMLKLVPSRERRTKIWKKHEKKMSRYSFNTHEKCTELCAGPHYMLNEYPRDAFRSAEYREFEGMTVPLPKGYDIYLRTAFGDYMQLPPEDKQVPHHDLEYIDLDTPWRKDTATETTEISQKDVAPADEAPEGEDIIQKAPEDETPKV